jgi:2-polyprenyl-3-methyl-5-hydroxy-6-metoxy-1,4-benzoquinol methylase
MSSTSVSVVVPQRGADFDASSIERYLETTGLTFELVSRVGDAKGSVIVLFDESVPVTAIGDAAAMVESGTTDIVFGTTRHFESSPLLRWLLVPILPDPRLRLKAFSSAAGKLIFSEAKIHDEAGVEIAFLANKYGFRVERLVVESTSRRRAKGGAITAIRIRMANRRNAYRAARRCPVCFSSEVWSIAQIPGNVVRACRRCKCRYLNQFTDDESTNPVRRVLRALTAPATPAYESHGAPARERTSLRRFRWVSEQLPPRARVLEVGVRDGSFGMLAAHEYEYVGIDPASAAARHARTRGLEVYCASLAAFVNTGPAFDALTLFHVFENMADPHDALGRIKDLLKPGGVLFLSTFDTEGLVYLASERRRMAQNFRTHLILYSRSALIELLERSGFEISDIGPDFEYRDHKFLRHWLASHHPVVAPLARAMLDLLPDPLIVSSGSIRIVAKRRGGQSLNVRAIRSVEPTHAR